MGWVVPPTLADSVLADGGRPVIADAVDYSGASESPQRSTPELLGCSEQSFDGRRENWLQWVLKKQSEVGEGVCYLLDQPEGTGDLLEVW